MMDEIIRLFPDYIKLLLNQSVKDKWDQLEEIRLRLNRPIEICFRNHIEWLPSTLFTQKESFFLLNQLSEHSLYRMEDELREGYITIAGGHRVGIAGEVITHHGKINRINQITYFNIRIAKQILNVATPLLPYLYHEDRYLNTVIIGVPQSGKTTMIRDLARLIGNGANQLPMNKVAIIDERSEIAACKDGIPQHEVGLRTDVMDACPKVDGMMMMIRSMSPDVLIVDEIGKKADAEAILEAVNAGVSIICSVHGSTINMLRHQPFIKPLMRQNLFQRIILLGKANQQNQMIQIYNESNSLISSHIVKRQ